MLPTIIKYPDINVVLIDIHALLPVSIYLGVLLVDF